MAVDAFLDTNILLYAYDLDAGDKRLVAQDIVAHAHKFPKRHAISIQVLQEFHVNFARSGGSHESGMALLEDFSAWKIVDNTLSVYRLGLAIVDRFQLSLWDAMVIAAAQTAQAPVLYSEDMNHGQDYGGVRVVNPFMN
jgi:predicted nucleic acid-binding protein